ncbi:MAG: hypothetical protein OQJ81_00915 [Melioribacteraceae bacterium]|nr:hypothetical protein [Melioribacteraceae bacterium]
MLYSKERINSNIQKEILRLNSKLELLISKSKTYSLIRLFVFLALTISFLGLYIYDYKTYATLFASLLGAVFLVLMHNHSKIEKSIKRFKVYIQIKKEELARSELDWENIPLLDSSVVSNPSYVEQDLNITEKNGLLQLISRGVSHSSVNILREWLSAENSKTESIINRQKIVKELKKLRRFREKLLLITRLSITKNLVKIDISEWIKNSSIKKGLKFYTVFLFILAIINISAIFGWAFGVLNNYYYQLLLIYLFFYFVGYNYVKDLKDASEFLYDEVSKYSSIFKFIEKYNYGRNNSIKSLLQPFLDVESSPSKELKKINLTIEILYLGKNPFVWFALICIAPIDYLLSINVEKFKESIKTDFPLWLNTWNNLEAYCSLAGFAFLNPNYKFPEFNERNQLIEAKNLGHPLIKYDCKIENDFSISDASLTNIITGSNMSGKSTFLRTIGCNILLANAGSVVNAEKFAISKFNLFTCIKVSDSVVDGISYFYSEVKRLKEIISFIKDTNANSLVLIDEIYKGTNNIERVIGSKALIKYFSTENIYSVVSTHDLELVKIADELNKVKNYHFKEIIFEDKMVFDFKLREGPCPTTNALKIMKMEGLPT